MKVALITDQHFGARNDSTMFLDFYEQFYKETFFPKIIEEEIKTVLVLGDTFDRRKYINFNTLQRSKDMFFNKLEELGITVYMLAGNHDTYYKNTNEVNSVDLLLKEYENIQVIDEPMTIHLNFKNDEDDILMIPWICADNYQRCLNEITHSRAKLCAGHFEIAGFAMYRGHPCEEGLNRELFRKFEYTFSGHYHHKSNADGIHYLGNPYELTWQDYNDPRGFHIFDLDSRDITFVRNPNIMFHRIVYDDTQELIKEFDEYVNKHVKVVVVNKTQPYMFDVFMDKLYGVNPSNITIVEDFTDLSEGLDDDMIDQAEDTLTIINKTVDTLAEDIDKIRMKNILRELYLEALNNDSI